MFDIRHIKGLELGIDRLAERLPFFVSPATRKEPRKEENSASIRGAGYPAASGSINRRALAVPAFTLL